MPDSAQIHTRCPQEGIHIFAISSWKELGDLTRRNFEAPRVDRQNPQGTYD